MLVILDIKWPAQLGGLYKVASAIVQVAPQVIHIYCISFTFAAFLAEVLAKVASESTCLKSCILFTGLMQVTL